MITPLYILIYFGTLPALFLAGFAIVSLAKAMRTRSHVASAGIVYEDWDAGGASQKNAFTRYLGLGQRHTRLVVTREILWVTARFPFTFHAALGDMLHVIPLDRILGVQRGSALFARSLYLSYADDDGEPHTLRLVPSNGDEFLRAIHHELEPAESTKPVVFFA